jgi:CBS domain-containing protein
MSPLETPGFQDPLENYDAPVFDDPVEQALHDESVESLKTTPFLSVSASTPVRVARKLMVGNQIACILIHDDDKLVGVFSDRDVLDRVALEYDQVIDGPVSAVMTADPVFVLESDSVAKVLSVMAVSGYRHVPVVNTEGTATGIVSPVRVSQYLSQHLRP